MAIVDAGVGCSNSMQCPHYHLCMLIACKGRPWRDDAVIQISFIVENGASTGSPSNIEHIFAIAIPLFVSHPVILDRALVRL